MAHIRWNQEAMYASRMALQRELHGLGEVIDELRDALRLAAHHLPPGMGFAHRLRASLGKAEAMQEAMQTLLRRMERTETCFEETERRLVEWTRALLHQAEEEARWNKQDLLAWIRKAPMELPWLTQIVGPPPVAMYTTYLPRINVSEAVKALLQENTVVTIPEWARDALRNTGDVLTPIWLLNRAL